MANMIVSPAEIVKLFADAYATLEPLVPISYDAKTALPMIVEDICCGRKVEPFRHGPNPFSRKAKRLQGQLCSMQFLGVLRTLRSMMRAHRVFHLTPTRPAELLYNFDFAEESFTQPFMHLKLRSDACYYSSRPRNMNRGLASGCG